MIADEGINLLRSLASLPSPQLPKYDDGALRAVLTEMNSMGVLLSQELDEISTMMHPPDSLKVKLFVHYQSLERSKRVGLAYLMERCRRIQLLCQASPILPPHVRENLSGDEELFVIKYSKLLSDLNASYSQNIFAYTAPPVHSTINIIVKRNLGAVVLPSGTEMTFEVGKILKVRRSDVENLIACGDVQVVADT
ncbi:hypothetical protein RCL1_004663 [Eukaryota sp. TZLM3-RCL]